MALDFNIIGQRLKEARNKKHITQQQLAEEIDVSVPFLSKVECGKNHINLKRLSEICNILGVSEGYILKGTSSNSKIYLDSEFSDILKKCSPKKQKLIYNIAKLISDEK